MQIEVFSVIVDCIILISVEFVVFNQAEFTPPWDFLRFINCKTHFVKPNLSQTCVVLMNFKICM